MSSYFIVELRHPETCDTAYGCGIFVRRLVAENMSDAQDEVEELVAQTSTGSLESETIYEVARSSDMDVRKVYASIASKKLEAVERAELERLTKKYNPA